MPVTNPGTAPNAFATLSDWQSIAQQMWNLYMTCKTMQQRQQQHAYVALYQATSTYTVNADGTPGANDVTPNNAHPMVGTYLTANEVSGFDGYGVNEFVNFVEGNTTLVADRRPAIQQMLP
jgi:hypothetical protein